MCGFDAPYTRLPVWLINNRHLSPHKRLTLANYFLSPPSNHFPYKRSVKSIRNEEKSLFKKEGTLKLSLILKSPKHSQIIQQITQISDYIPFTTK
uniref:Uncharacterized protein n=1 Tax=Timema genevievae TaxID=629358 RepID=A0A7R9K604_TIMGE|nr:unnamed protein product [Timema genevievae]